MSPSYLSTFALLSDLFQTLFQALSRPTPSDSVKSACARSRSLSVLFSNVRDVKRDLKRDALACPLPNTLDTVSQDMTGGWKKDEGRRKR